MARNRQPANLPRSLCDVLWRILSRIVPRGRGVGGQTVLGVACRFRRRAPTGAREPRADAAARRPRQNRTLSHARAVRRLMPCPQLVKGRRRRARSASCSARCRSLADTLYTLP